MGDLFWGGLLVGALLLTIVIANWKGSKRPPFTGVTMTPPGAQPGEAIAQGQLVARRERVSSFVGTGCLIQGLGLLAPFLLPSVLLKLTDSATVATGGFVVGLGVLLILFFVGSAKATRWRCGNCRNPLADGSVRMCPTCRATLT